jgi:transcriptional regulator with AAA-type ATPase domain
MDLLRVIETKQFTRMGGNEIIKVDFRIICATNKDLERAMNEGALRLITVRVGYSVQGQDYDVRLSTVVDTTVQ